MWSRPGTGVKRCMSRYEKPELIILDLMMPEMGGYDFLRAFSKEATTPVIILTAKVEDQGKNSWAGIRHR